jgi:hypothetical protein
MSKLLVLSFTIALCAGCSFLKPSQDPSAPGQCYVESGWQDASNGCSARAGYPDCYLVCPSKGTRTHL